MSVHVFHSRWWLPCPCSPLPGTVITAETAGSLDAKHYLAGLHRLCVPLHFQVRRRRPPPPCGPQVQAAVEAETEAKVARLMALDASKDGFVPRRVSQGPIDQAARANNSILLRAII